MSLAERAANRPVTINGYPCSVGTLLNDLDGPELAALQFILYGKPGLTEPTRGYRGWNEREVFIAVTAEGYAVAKNQINVHRGKRCRCYKDAV